MPAAAAQKKIIVIDSQTKKRSAKYLPGEMLDASEGNGDVDDVARACLLTVRRDS